MADLVNPYANPYLPSFVNQRPVMNNQPPQNTMPTPHLNYSGVTFGQIHSVNGFDGARSYAGSMANGSSEILAESDPNLSRVYIVAKDANGQTYIQGGDFTPVEEPKPITVEELNSKMNTILEKLNRMEEKGSNDQSIRDSSWKNADWSSDAESKPGIRTGSNVPESGIGN